VYKEMLTELSLKIKSSDSLYKNEDIEFVEKYARKCGEYVEKVNAMETAINIGRYRMEPEEYREYVMELDRIRKIAHDALIADTKMLNRICEIYNYPPIYTGSLDDRNEIAEFAKKIVDEFFEGRQKA